MSAVGAVGPADGSGHGGHVVPGALSSPGSALSAVVGAVSGIAPHVLHHIGPLAGTALLAGAGGTVLFGAIGLVLSIPMFLRLRRRFGTWLAPLVAAVVFSVVYLLSSLVVGAAITGAGAPGASSPTASPLPSDHDDHH